MNKIVKAHLNDILLRTIEVYNRYRSPEATAKLVGIKKDGFIIEFKGAFCQSCGVNDYFEDFAEWWGQAGDKVLDYLDPDGEVHVM